MDGIKKLDSIPTRFNVDVGSAHFECLFKEGNHDWLYVFLGSTTDSSNKGGPESSHRWSWYPFIEGHSLFIEDPMRFKYPNLIAGWFLGTEGEDYTKYTSDLVKRIATKYKVPQNHIVFYGNSSGGTAAIACAQHIGGSISVSLNPQLLPKAFDAYKENFNKETGIEFDNPLIEKRINTEKIVKRKKNRNILVIDHLFEENARVLHEWCRGMKLSPRIGLTQRDNLTLWAYEARGSTGPSMAADGVPMFLAIQKMIRSTCDYENYEELNGFIEENQDNYAIFNSFLYEIYDVKRQTDMSEIRFLITSKDPSCLKRAYDLCMPYAHEGDVDAIALLGRMHLNGIHVEKDLDVAIDWIRKATDGDSSITDYELVDMLLARASQNDLKEAFEICQRLSEKGDWKAMIELGHMYRDGVHVNKDLELATKWIEEAARIDATSAQYELNMISRLKSSPSSLEMTLDELQALAEEGDVDSMGQLGRIYRDGVKAKRNLDVAIKWLNMAVDNGKLEFGNDLIDLIQKGPYEKERADLYDRCSMLSSNGDGVAIGLLGKMHYVGLNVNKDVDVAIDLTRKASDMDVAWASIKLAYWLLDRSYPGDQKEAYELCIRLSDKGIGEAMGLIGVMYQKGQHVEKDEIEAIKWMTLAAKNGSTRTGNNLVDLLQKRPSFNERKEAYDIYSLLATNGSMDAIGIIGRMQYVGIHVEKDLDAAIENIRRASDRNIIWARVKLAYWLLERSSPADREEAYNLCAKMADRGNRDAMGLLGRMYRDGTYVERNPEKAISWMTKAAEKELPWAKRELSNMTKEEEEEPSPQAKEGKPKRAK